MPAPVTTTRGGGLFLGWRGEQHVGIRSLLVSPGGGGSKGAGAAGAGQGVVIVAHPAGVAGLPAGVGKLHDCPDKRPSAKHPARQQGSRLRQSRLRGALRAEIVRRWLICGAHAGSKAAQAFSFNAKLHGTTGNSA